MAELGNTEQEILRLSALVADAERRKDAEAVARHLAHSYTGIDPSGELIDRAMLLDRYRSGEFNLDALKLTDISISAAQDAAWEFGVMDLAGSLGEQKFSGKYRYSHFWVRSEAGWLIAGSQLTPILSQE